VHAGRSNNVLLVYPDFVLSNNAETKLADYAAYRVTRGTIGKSERDDWHADPNLQDRETLEPEDYRGAHAALKTDRGHQVPLASFSAIKDPTPLNYLSNCTPQNSKLNQRLWNHLEMAVRDLALRREVRAVHVLTGPLYERIMPELPGADEAHRVPSGYFKIVALPAKAGASVAAVVVEQTTDGDDSHCAHLVTVREVEQRTGWNFFPELGESVSRELEEQPGQLASELGCGVR
jgi:endonuclease G